MYIHACQVSIRLGILLVSATDADQNVGTVLTRGFYYISEHYTGRQALDWLLEVVTVRVTKGKVNQARM